MSLCTCGSFSGGFSALIMKVSISSNVCLRPPSDHKRGVDRMVKKSGLGEGVSIGWVDILWVVRGADRVD